MSLAKFTARSLLSAIFITGGLDEIKKADQLSEAVDGLLSKLPKSSCSQIPDVD
ncbi:DoxX protein, partial [Cutibacterium acnes subsp. acnes]|nr:DoxX protein [Cutibacterium acnes subsp. acnes]